MKRKRVRLSGGTFDGGTFIGQEEGLRAPSASAGRPLPSVVPRSTIVEDLTKANQQLSQEIDRLRARLAAFDQTKVAEQNAKRNAARLTEENQQLLQEVDRLRTRLAAVDCAEAIKQIAEQQTEAEYTHVPYKKLGEELTLGAMLSFRWAVTEFDRVLGPEWSVEREAKKRATEPLGVLQLIKGWAARIPQFFCTMGNVVFDRRGYGSTNPEPFWLSPFDHGQSDWRYVSPLNAKPARVACDITADVTMTCTALDSASDDYVMYMMSLFPEPTEAEIHELIDVYAAPAWSMSIYETAELLALWHLAREMNVPSDLVDRWFPRVALLDSPGLSRLLLSKLQADLPDMKTTSNFWDFAQKSPGWKYLMSAVYDDLTVDLQLARLIHEFDERKQADTEEPWGWLLREFPSRLEIHKANMWRQPDIGGRIRSLRDVFDDAALADSVACNTQYVSSLLTYDTFRQPSRLVNKLHKLSANEDIALEDFELIWLGMACLDEYLSHIIADDARWLDELSRLEVLTRAHTACLDTATDSRVSDDLSQIVRSLAETEQELDSHSLFQLTEQILLEIATRPTEHGHLAVDEMNRKLVERITWVRDEIKGQALFNYRNQLIFSLQNIT